MTNPGWLRRPSSGGARTRWLAWALATIVALCAALAIYSEWIGMRAAQDHPPRGRFVSADGLRLHYRDARPSGSPRGTIVLVHGAWAAHDDLFAALTPVLTDYRVIAIDRPGQGWSERGGAAMADPARQAGALMQALDTLAPEPFVLLAHSLGAPLATEIALRRRERLKGLVLLGPVTHPWLEGTAALLARASASPAGPLLDRVVGVPLASLLLQAGASLAFAPNPVPPDYAESAALPLILRPAAFGSNARDLVAAQAFLAEQAARYRELSLPVVAIVGAEDRLLSPAHHAEAFARQVPQARLVRLPGVEHMPHRAAPALVAREIDGLLARIEN